jgi:predicted double-glycine peptidase
MSGAAARRVLSVALGVAAAAGCAHTSGPTPVAAPDGRWIVVPHATLVPQRGDADCGPAALATALARWDAVPSARIWRDGATARALRDEARRSGFQAFVVEGTFEDLAAEIGAGRPVVVGLVRLERGVRTPHFAVVVGRDPRRNRWLLADPALGVQDVGADALETEWARSGWVTLVIYPKLPDGPARRSMGA